MNVTMNRKKRWKDKKSKGQEVTSKFLIPLFMGQSGRSISKQMEQEMYLRVTFQRDDIPLPTDFDFTCFSWIPVGKLFHTMGIKKMSAVGTFQGAIVLLDHTDSSKISYVSLLCGHHDPITDLIVSIHINSFFSIDQHGTLCGWSCEDGSCLINFHHAIDFGDHRLYLYPTNTDYLWISSIGSSLTLFDIVLGARVVNVSLPGLLSFSIITPLTCPLSDKTLLTCVTVSKTNVYLISEDLELTLTQSEPNPEFGQQVICHCQFGIIKLLGNEFQLLSPGTNTTIFSYKFEGFLPCGVFFDDPFTICFSSLYQGFRIIKFNRFNRKNPEDIRIISIQEITKHATYQNRFDFNIDDGLLFSPKRGQIVCLTCDNQYQSTKIKNSKEILINIPRLSEPIILEMDNSSTLALSSWETNLKQYYELKDGAITAIASRYVQNRLLIVIGDSNGCITYSWADSKVKENAGQALQTPVIGLAPIPEVTEFTVAIGEDGSSSLMRWATIKNTFVSDDIPVKLVAFIPKDQLIVIGKFSDVYLLFNFDDPNPLSIASSLPHGSKIIWRASEVISVPRGQKKVVLQHGSKHSMSISLFKTGSFEILQDKSIQKPRMSNSMVFDQKDLDDDEEYSSDSVDFEGNPTSILVEQTPEQLQCPVLTFPFKFRNITKTIPIHFQNHCFYLVQFDPFKILPKDVSSAKFLCDLINEPGSGFSFAITGYNNIFTCFYSEYKLTTKLTQDLTSYQSALIYITFRYLSSKYNFTCCDLDHEVHIKIAKHIPIYINLLFYGEDDIKKICRSIIVESLPYMNREICSEFVASLVNKMDEDRLGDDEKLLVSIILIVSPDVIPVYFHTKMLEYLNKNSYTSSQLSVLIIILILKGFNFWSTLTSKTNLFLICIVSTLKSFSNDEQLTNLFYNLSAEEFDSFRSAIIQRTHEVYTLMGVQVVNLLGKVGKRNIAKIGSKTTLALAYIAEDRPALTHICYEHINYFAREIPHVTLDEDLLYIGVNETLYVFYNKKFLMKSELFQKDISIVEMEPKTTKGVAISNSSNQMKQFQIDVKKKKIQCSVIDIPAPKNHTEHI